ncbi:SusC/RagA family TonB-linked outer membrane protein [Coprobacter secundus]|uniref:SusC/RagA family TonB-linked outer membrane protein n=1 Tax=Coprobacter secundus TaxID=1501392 RepID=UPI0005749550|nr:hypothetical protein PU94_03140 [Coprobacter secundus]
MEKIYLKFLFLSISFSLCTIFCLHAQKITVKGIVISSQKEPLIGVGIIEEGTTNGTITDIDGKFSISVASHSKLKFSYVGYTSKIITVGNETNLTIILEENMQNLDEVVVIGYGTVKKSDLTGAVSSIKASELNNTPTSDIESALQGKVSGVFISKKSGRPGDAADVKIRGIGSFNSSGPLWVIDGVQQSPGVDFNMNDAESIEILKDASAAAIYGAAAANGVIIVTTKRGKKGETKVNFNAYVGFAQPTNMIKPLNSGQLKRLRIEDFNGQGYMSEEAMKNFPLEENQKGYALDYEPTNADYNWKDLLFSRGITQNYDISLSKGEENYNFYTSFNYYNEKGTYIDTGFRRYSFRFNSDVKLYKWLSMGENLQLTCTNLNPYADSRYLNNFLRTLPFTIPYDSSNQPGGFGYFPKTDNEGNEIDVKSILAGYDGGNPLADELTHNESQKKYNLNGSIYLKVEPIKQFNVTATFAGGLGSGITHIENSEYQYHALKKRDYTSMNENLGTSYGWTTNIVANYHQEFGAHSLTAMIGFEAAYGWGTTLRSSAQNMLGGLYMISMASKADRNVESSYSNNATASYFGRINYGYKDKYLFTAVLRRDASDRFAPKYRWGTFPSFSAAWRISDESFLRDNADWLNQLKIHASWGILGNSGISQFLYTSTYNTYTGNYAFGSGDPQTPVTGLLLDRLPNSNIKWEEITTTDIGIDLAVLNNTLTFSADWYIKNTSDALFNTSLPDLSGLGIKTNPTPSYIMNVGKIRNTGADFEIAYRNRIGKDFNYNINGNISFFKNKVLTTNESNDILISGNVLSGTNISYTQKGLPMSTFYGYQVEGVFQTQEEVDFYNTLAQTKGNQFYQESGTAPGDLRFKDINRDGKIDSADITNIGNPWPNFTYGFNLGFNWKFIDFNIFFQGVQGGKIFNEYRSKTHTLYSDYNTTTYALNRWVGPGSTNENFRMAVDDPNGNESKASTWYLESASYFRLKNIQLGFTIPKEWTQKAKINRCRLYVAAQNLWTLTQYEGFDPEFSTGANTEAGIDRGNYPQNRVIQCGVQLDF